MAKETSSGSLVRLRRRGIALECSAAVTLRVISFNLYDGCQSGRVHDAGAVVRGESSAGRLLFQAGEKAALVVRLWSVIRSGR